MSELVPHDDHLLEDAASFIQATPRVPIPVTGEVIETNDPASVAAGVEALDDLMAHLDELRSLLTLLLRAESQRQGTKTLSLGDLTVVLSGGERVTYDAAELAVALEDAGLPSERLEQVVKPTLTWKVDGLKIRQLEAANPLYKVIIDRHRTRKPAPWRATVKR